MPNTRKNPQARIAPREARRWLSHLRADNMRLRIYMLWGIFGNMHISPDTLFRAMADSTRLRSLFLLQSESELCVCELTYALGESQPKVSRHLAQLREVGIVADRRSGLWVYYRLHPELPDWARAVIEAAVKGTADESPFAGDRARLGAMPDRPEKSCCA